MAKRKNQRRVISRETVIKRIGEVVTELKKQNSDEDKQFSISLSSGFLFLYDDLLNYDFHKKTILELLRITTKEIRIWPIVNMKGNKSSLVEPLINDNDFNRFQICIEKVDYEFLRSSNEMMVIKNSK